MQLETGTPPRLSSLPERANCFLHACVVKYISNENDDVSPTACNSNEARDHDGCQAPMAERICVAATRHFGTSLQSFYTEDELDVKEAKQRALPGVDRVVVEVCCGEFSRISERRNHEDDSCLCIRVTVADDLGQPSTVRAIVNVMKT